MIDEFSLSSITIATPEEIITNASIRVTQGKIKDFSKSSKKDYQFEKSSILFPAIINAHDHLFGTYYPKVGTGTYICWLPWDYDLKSSPVYEERNRNTPFEIYQIGAYKNLISGVTTVHDHIPHHINEPYIDKLPVRVLQDYTLAHEASVYDLKWGDGIDVEHRRAVQNNVPFVTHIEEGFDEESMRGIEVLEDYKALSEHTVLIHGIGFSDGDIKTIAKRKANFVWCPGSNMYMFARTARIKEIIDAGINVSIGTDSPASGELNILHEIRFAKKIFNEMYGKDLEDKMIVRMITVNPAKAFRVQDRLGSLEKNKIGDLLIIDGEKKDPYASLVNADFEDISLVFKAGMPMYGDKRYEHIFKDFGQEYTHITVDGSDKLIVGDPQTLMETVRKNAGYNKELPFLPI
jgi:5-methylthioadenosine/S-adenosylhomocysteine deaminase